MLSRRALVGKLAAFAAVGAGVARTSFASTRNDPSFALGSEPGGSPQDLGLEGSVPTLLAESLPDAQALVEPGPPTTLTAPPPWELIHPLEKGTLVGHGWQVAALTGVVDGSCVLTLQNERGREHRVHLCRNDGRPQGLVYTERLDLVVMNGGQGDLPTDEGFAQAVAAVAHVLAANERGRRDVVAELLPHEQRLDLFAGAVDRRLR